MGYLVMALILFILGIICVYAFALWSPQRISRKKRHKK